MAGPLDFVLYLLFFFPGMLALFWFGCGNRFGQLALLRSQLEFPGAYPDLFLQDPDPAGRCVADHPGHAELVRCWKAMKTGVWMDRLDDVKETEDRLIVSEPAADKSCANLSAFG